jgi:heat-inducible transcriptional repressor
MSDLEELGLIASPHTSAGRMPTARGYRLFVDTMLTVRREQLPPWSGWPRPSLAAEQPQPGHQPGGADAVQPVAVCGRGDGAAPPSVFRHIEFLSLSERRVLVIMVSPDGDVQNRIIHTQSHFTQSQLQEAANFLNAPLRRPDDGRGARAPEDRGGRPARRDRLAHGQGRGAGSEPGAEAQDEVVVAGERNLLSVSEFSQRHGPPAPLFDLFEQKTQLMRLLDVSSQAEGVRIFIGGESQVVPFEELSVVSAPYEVDGQVVGTLGVIGPQRMPYDRMIQIVDITSKLVSNALSHK